MSHSVIYVCWHLAEILNLMSLIPKNEATNNFIQCISLVYVPSLEIIVIPFKEKLVWRETFTKFHSWQNLHDFAEHNPKVHVLEIHWHYA